MAKVYNRFKLIEAGEYYKGKELEPGILFVLLSCQDILAYEGKAIPNTMEVWLNFGARR